MQSGEGESIGCIRTEEHGGRFEARTVEVCGVALGTALLNASLPAGGELIYECRGSCRDEEEE